MGDDSVGRYIIVVCQKWQENSRALASNVQVGDNWYSVVIIGHRPVSYWKEEWETTVSVVI
jgi:hypothetical protein